ncbi:MAG: hypothetical protein GY865_03500 [candidate division Zixibacteria bacterium]|nr:hypothetical protein [candidate division Zixibacteria bacterium]
MNRKLTDTDNLEDRLERVEDGTGTIIARYGYDPFGRRIWKEVTGTKTYFMYADEGLVGEYDSAGTELKTYGWKPGSTWGTDPLFMKIGSEYYFYHNDHLGTPQKMTAVNGLVVWAAKYSSFGKAEVDPGSGVENNLRFPGQYFDGEIGLHYNWHRYYDPILGRYIKIDPIGFKGGDISLYIYSRNNPMFLIDPLGLKSEKCSDCPGGEWTSFSNFAISAFWGGGGTMSHTTYTCKSNGLKCTATSVCFGGGVIGAAGLGVDAGGYPGFTRGVTDTYNKSDFKKFSSGVYVTAGPVSQQHTGSSSNIGLSKSWGLGVAYITCTNFSIICNN